MWRGPRHWPGHRRAGRPAGADPLLAAAPRTPRQTAQPGALVTLASGHPLTRTLALTLSLTLTLGACSGSDAPAATSGSDNPTPAAALSPSPATATSGPSGAASPLATEPSAGPGAGATQRASPTAPTAPTAPTWQLPWRVSSGAGETAYRMQVPAATTDRVIALPLAVPAGGHADQVGPALAVRGSDGAFVLAARALPAEARLAVRSGAPVAVLAAGAAVSVTVETTDRLVDAATWVRRGTTRSLRVTPTWAARGPAGAAAVWGQLQALRPEADTPGMRDQLTCHVDFAPTKPVWFLEPARPAVGYAATVLAACNPGDVPDGG